ncbi:MAG: imidazoleglycerol-phosphate dehydratase HisB [Ruminococcus sp.]|nr:imidazoleglycerol-phosphate dehydratase HisB [Ruminococcus sp.]
MRNAQIERKTKETDIKLSLSLDGGEVKVDTGVGFFDHMLNSFSTHGGFGLNVKVTGDLNVDDHHTVEDTGIVLGTAFKEALGDKSSIERFGSFYVPMDEALSFASVDVSGRPFLVFDADFPQEKCGDYTSAMTVEFMRAFAFNAGITLHIKCLYGSNSHHIIESIYKAVAHAVRLAVKPNNSGEVLSTKGVL